MSKPSEAPPAAEPNFEQALGSLEQIVLRLEQGDDGLEAALAQYEQGVGLLKQCYAMLARAERKIELLSKVDATGNYESEPFDDSATSTQPASSAKTASRSQRRSKPSAPPAAAPAPPLGESGMDESPGLF